MSKIIISKYATGSWPTNIGDTTLFYTGESSQHAKAVEGIFNDNPPRLSPDCAGLVWRYYQDTDRYILIHVQGSQVVNAALGRNYPFRAAYEVSRDDMNSINFNIPAVFTAVPRISTMKGGRVPLETEVDEEMRWPKEEKTLKRNILDAFYCGKQLYIELDVRGKKYHEDGIFNARELHMLLGAISLMPEDVKRYITFAFCVDNNYAYVLDDVSVVVFLKNRNVKVPDGILPTTWEKVTTEEIAKNKVSNPFHFTLPGKKGPLKTFSELRIIAAVAQKKVEELEGEEWQKWIETGHNLSEVETKSWAMFVHFLERMDEKTRKDYIGSMRATSVEWELTGLTEKLYALMEYDENRKSILRRKPEALKTMLEGENTYVFLYPKGKLSQDAIKAIDANFLKELDLKIREDVEKWYCIFKKYRCISKGVEDMFIMLFTNYAIPYLSMDGVLEYMKKYPFIPGSNYQKPKDFTLPTKKQLSGIALGLCDVINKWDDQETMAFTFKTIGYVIDCLGDVKNLNKVEKKALEKIDKECVVQLLLDKLAKLEEQKIDNDAQVFEDFLEVIVSLPKSFNKRTLDTFLPAVEDVLFIRGGDNNLTKEHMLDVSKWADICRKYKDYPYVFFFIKKRLSKLVDNNNLARELKERMKYAFILPKKEKCDNNFISSDSNQSVPEDIKFEIETHYSDGKIDQHIDVPNSENSKNDANNVKPDDVKTVNCEEKNSIQIEGEVNNKLMRCVKSCGRKLKEPISKLIVKVTCCISKGEKAKIKYSENANDAYPLIKTYIKTISSMNNNDAKELEKFFKELKAVKEEKKRQIVSYFFMGLWFVIGFTFSVVLLWPFKENKDNQFQTEIAVNQNMSTLKKHPLLQLADSLSIIGYGATIKEFVCNDQKFDVQLDTIETLLPVSKAYAGMANVETVTAYLDIKAKNGIVKKDTVIIKADNTLLEATNHEGCRLNKIVIGSVTIDIPNKKLATNDMDDMSNPYYYFRVISYIANCISEEMSWRIAY